MVYIKFGIVFELFVYKIHGHGDSDGAFLCGTEILNSRLNEMDFSGSEVRICVEIYLLGR